jgi:GT2 family glycosyltransferase
MTVSVIVPVFRGGEDLRRCLASLAAAEPRPLEVVVVDDGSDDGSAAAAAAMGAKVLRLPETGGPARARNCGARAARGALLFFVDADVSVPRDAIARVTAAFDDPTVAAVIGSYDAAPGAPNFLSQYKNLLHHYVHQTSREEAATFWGACGAIRRDVFLALGGFDERYRRPSIEDVELGYRLRQAGHRIRLCKTLQVTHWKRWTVPVLLRSDFCDRALPWTALILRHGRWLDDLNLRAASRISGALVFGLGAALLGGWWRSSLWWVAGLLAGGLLAVNAPLYAFFARQRGLWFAARTVPWHWLYYFYSGLALAGGVARHLWARRPASEPASPAVSG